MGFDDIFIEKLVTISTKKEKQTNKNFFSYTGPS